MGFLMLVCMCVSVSCELDVYICMLESWEMRDGEWEGGVILGIGDVGDGDLDAGLVM